MQEEAVNREKLDDGFRVGGYLVEPRLQRITRGHESRTVEPKVMEVLLCLAETPGRPVSKAQFMEEVWSDTIVTDDALLRCISELRKIFDDDARDPSYIETIRKRGYRLIAPVSVGLEDGEADGAPGLSTVPAGEQEEFGTGSRLRAAAGSVWFWAGSAVVVLFLAVLWIGRFFPADFTVPLRSVPLTSYPGEESDPNLSPDGEHVAFVWDGGNGGSFDIYVKSIEAASPVRLTSSSSADDLSPVWSPDGSRIAFLRTDEEQSSIFVVPVEGGSERRLIDLGSREAHALSWSPDGQLLAVSAERGPGEPFVIWLLSPDSLRLRQATEPPADYRGDRELAFSPDGRSLAFSRSVLDKVDDVYVLSLRSGETRRITNDNAEVTGLDWSARGREVVFSSDREGVPSLWRVPASGGQAVWVPTSGEGYGVHQPSLSRNGRRLAFVQRNREINVWDVELGGDAPRERPVIASTRWDSNPALSPDGSRIAFISNRSGSYEVWMSDRDGGEPVRLTSLRGPFAESPRWSPDGRHLAFVANEEGSADIYVIDADGGSPVRLTTAASNDKAPNWSRDGEWIYFASNRTGSWETWRTRSDGSIREQVTSSGGFAAAEGPGGLYVVRREAPGLWLLPDDGRPERLVIPDLQPADWANWVVTGDAVYYVRRSGGNAALVAFDTATGRERVVDHLDRLPRHPSLAVSSDGRRILYARIDRSESDVLFVEDFR